jgi:Allene oxide cyclase barrel like domain
MRKQLLAVAAVAAIVAVGIAILSERGAAAGGDDSVIRIVELAEVQKVIPPPSDGPVGTRYIFSSGIYDTAGQRIGRDGADCVQTNPDGTFHCVISVILPDGELTFQGLATGTENTFAITGGTGAFRNARGEAHAVDTEPGRAEVTIRVIGYARA